MPHAHTDRVTDIEDRLRSAAFGSDLAVSDAVLTEASAAGPLPRWLAAVVLGARGYYARAAALLEPLLGCRDRVLASLAASTLASHRRQLGGHASARVFDAAALRAISGVWLAGGLCRAAGPDRVEAGGTGLGRDSSPAIADPDGVDVAGAVADAILGLAADALALGRQREARRLLSRVAAREPSCWRARVRYAWVSAEVELAAGAATAARPHAERAAAIAREHGSTRHALKSDLVLAAALSAAAPGAMGTGSASPDTGEPDAADGPSGVTIDTSTVITLAEQVRDDTRKLGLYPLTWPAALLLSDANGTDDVAAASELRQEAVSVVHVLLRRADPLARSLAMASPWVPKVD